ncbi:ribonuclease P protein component [Arenibaculum pallidiluteum]|uniref:ribonuclease P protein component n=1 Tax=Arenibaculum pallidiluteum TaxID=2812559 RepID=UPI001A96AB75|nr:ribonuclease P protein component [Arenibaculum pallidiluteum]
MPPTPRRPVLGRLKRRPEFLAVAGARRKWAAPGLILQARAHDDRQRPEAGEPSIRVGFTASKKVGNSVERNRARRRLRAAAREVLASEAAPGHDYVLIARGETLRRGFADLKADIAKGLERLRARKPAAQAPDGAAGTLRGDASGERGTDGSEGQGRPAPKPAEAS